MTDDDLCVHLRCKTARKFERLQGAFGAVDRDQDSNIWIHDCLPRVAGEFVSWVSQKQNWKIAVTSYGLGDAAQNEPAKAGAAVSPHDDEIGA